MRIVLVILITLLVYPASSRQEPKLETIIDLYQECATEMVVYRIEGKIWTSELLLDAVDFGIDSCKPFAVYIRKVYGETAAMEAYLRTRAYLTFNLLKGE